MKVRANSVVTGALAIAALWLGACHPASDTISRSKWVSAMLDVQLEISSQLLKLETDKDALIHGAEAIDCSPAASQTAYTSVATSLRTLLSEGERLRLAGGYRQNIERVLEEWASIERRHNANWEASKMAADLPPAEKCMRPSDIVLTRLTIERSMASAIKGALGVD